MANGHQEHAEGSRRARVTVVTVTAADGTVSVVCVVVAGLFCGITKGLSGARFSHFGFVVFFGPESHVCPGWTGW